MTEQGINCRFKAVGMMQKVGYFVLNELKPRDVVFHMRKTDLQRQRNFYIEL